MVYLQLFRRESDGGAEDRLPTSIQLRSAIGIAQGPGDDRTDRSYKDPSSNIPKSVGSD
jgi:hypothetical protein